MDFRNEETIVDVLSMAEERPVIGLEKAEIPTSKDITGIEVRLSRVLIKDNGTEAVWPFPGLAKMYLLLIVVSDRPQGGADPIKLELKGFPKVADHEELPVDRTLFYWKKAGDDQRTPGQIHIFASVIKSKEALRDVGQVLDEVKGDDNYKNLATSITGLMSDATPAGAVVDIIFSVAGIVGKYLGKVKDKPWFTWVQSFTDIYGDLDQLGHNIRKQETDKVAMSLNLIIRDKGREESAMKGLTEEQRAELGMDEH